LRNLDITMDAAVAVEVVEALKDLLGEEDDLFFT